MTEPAAAAPRAADPDAADQADMLALQGGEDRALDRLMARWERPLRGFLFRHTQHEHDALDLAQETFVRVYLHRARFRRGARFSTWLFQIALNLARDRARRLGRRPTAPLDAAPEPATAAGEDPGATTEQAEQLAALRAAVAALPEDQRAAVLLFEYEGRPQAEIAAILGTTAKGVETRLYRARQTLRTRLARWLRE